MRKTIAFVTIFAAAFCLATGCTSGDSGAGSAESSTQGTIATDQEIAWETSFEAALKQSAETQKPVMVDFYADWCGPCKMLDKNTYSDARVVSAATNWVSAKVDVDEETALSAKYEVDSIPTIVFIAPDGEEVSRFTGYVGPEQMLEQMEKARGLMASK